MNTSYYYKRDAIVAAVLFIVFVALFVLGMAVPTDTGFAMYVIGGLMDVIGFMSFISGILLLVVPMESRVMFLPDFYN